MSKKKRSPSPDPMSKGNPDKTDEIRKLIQRKQAENNVLKKIIEQKIKPNKQN